VVVGMYENQPTWRQHNHREVAADGVQVERRLTMNQVSQDLFVGKGDVKNVRDQRRVVARLLDLADQVGRLLQGHGDMVTPRRGSPRTGAVMWTSVVAGRSPSGKNPGHPATPILPGM